MNAGPRAPKRCDKKRHKTREVAHREARRLKRTGRVLYAYYCEACAAWHHSSLDLTQQRLIEKARGT